MEERTCNKCGQTKPLLIENFRGKRKVCRECDRAYSRAYAFKRLRGITHEERDEILKNQGNCCKSCGKDTHGSKKGWHVDHCHRSGKIRGVLCANCNIALGQVDDSIRYLQHLIEYLEKHGNERATTIPKGSTPQAIGGGSGEPLMKTVHEKLMMMGL